MKYLSIDIETFSDISLTDCGVYKYTDTPNFEILLLAYAIDDEPVKIIDLASGEKIPKAIEKAIFDKTIIKTAFNAQFERVCLSKHYNTMLTPEGWQCTMVQAASLGYPGSLDSVSKALGFPVDTQKLFTGKNLIRIFSIPRKAAAKIDKNQMSILKNKTRLMPSDRPEEWEQFKTYCMQDVTVEREVRKTLERFTTTSAAETQVWHLDQKINDYGVKLDRPFVQQAIRIDEQYTQELINHYNALGLENPKSVTELKKFLSKKLGREIRYITKQTIPDLKKEAEDIPEALEALEIRQEIAKTSVSKYAKMDEVICSDDRARGLLQFYGAGTGRWAGRLVQVQNLPQNKIKDLDLARQLVADGDMELIELCYPSLPVILSQLIRTAFIPSENHRFIVSDFSAIEARVIAWIAGESWRMDVFRTHGKIYEASAAQMFKVPIESIDKGSPLRQKGKVAELALGYQGSVGALRQMDRKWAANASEDELQELVSQWRAANIKIVKFWKDVQAAAMQAIEDRTVVKLQKGVKFIYEPDFLFIQLPSGRRLAYPKPAIEPHHEFRGRNKITFEGQDLNRNPTRADTYGGKLVENIVQASARDCLRDAMLRLDAAGYKIAFHVHDEVVLDVPEGWGSLEEVNQIMGRPLTWAPDLPLRGDGFITYYYMKD